MFVDYIADKMVENTRRKLKDDSQKYLCPSGYAENYVGCVIC